jgi:hypothetical protein
MFSALRRGAVHSLQRSVTHRVASQHTALQRSKTCCNAAQHVASQRGTLHRSVTQRCANRCVAPARIGSGRRSRAVPAADDRCSPCQDARKERRSARDMRSAPTPRTAPHRQKSRRALGAIFGFARSSHTIRVCLLRLILSPLYSVRAALLFESFCFHARFDYVFFSSCVYIVLLQHTIGMLAGFAKAAVSLVIFFKPVR